MLRTLAFIAIGGTVAYVGYQYYKQQKDKKCSCDDETVAVGVTAPAVGAETPEPTVQQYAASPRDTLTTPARLLINADWPNNGTSAQDITKM